jgi:hypothetical protein
MMFRKTMALMAALSCLAVFSSTEVSARGGFGGGFRGGGGGFHGFHGGGFYGGWRGGGYGWRGGGYGWGGRGLGLGIGLGLAGAYGGWGYPYGYGYGYPASYASYGDGGCYIRRQRIWTDYGWRFRPVRVCVY